MLYTYGTLIYDHTFNRYGEVAGFFPDELHPKTIRIKWSDYDKEFCYPKGIFDQMIEADVLSIIETEDS